MSVLLRVVAVVMPVMVAIVMMMAVMYFHYYLSLRRNRRSETEEEYQCKEDLFHDRAPLLENGQCAERPNSSMLAAFLNRV
jgi:uncharacterized membrane protein